MATVDLTVRDVAEELQVSAQAVRVLCAQGKIISYRVGVTPGSRTAPIRIRRKDLDAFKEKQLSANRWGTRKR